MIVRASVFFVISIILLFVGNLILELAGVEGEYYRLLFAVVLGLTYALYPFSCTRLLFFFFQAPLVVIGIVEAVIFFVAVLGVCIAEFSTLIIQAGIFMMAGFTLMGWLGASIGTILGITVILLIARKVFNFIGSTWKMFLEMAEAVSKWWFLWPARLINALSKLAETIGKDWLGGDIGA